MMDMAELVRTIVQEVLERTEAARAKACVRVLAPRDEALAERVRTLVAPYYEDGADLLFLGEEDHGRRPVRHILPVLSCSDMAALAVGRAASACMEEVLGLPVTHGDLLGSTERRLIDEWIDAGARE